jgi:murein DD-endopeptidase MepM/ murein hydrolase activator NlpD
VLASFVPPRSTWGAGHRGIDVAARQGQVVLAVDAGVVSHVGVIAGRGTVSVTHPSGLRSTYEPVRAGVTKGAAVAEGDVVGEVTGRTHCGGSCLHLGALVGQTYVDPRVLLGGGPVVLLPLTPGR